MLLLLFYYYNYYIIYIYIFAIVNVLIQSGITYKYRKTLAILCKLVMPIKQLFIQKQPGGVPEVSFHVTNVTGESHARSCAYHESPHDECDLFTKF